METWVFDLDNTLYPAGQRSLAEDRRAHHACSCAQLFGLDGLSTRALQKYYYQRYGTTLRGLMEEHGIYPDDFWPSCTTSTVRRSRPNHSLAKAITELPGRKLILTNGSREHALRTAEQLGIHEMFEDIFDIVAADLVPKPQPEHLPALLRPPRRRSGARRHVRGHIAQSRRAARARHGDDTRGAEAANSATIPRALGTRGRERRHVDFVTNDLEGFLAGPIAAVFDRAPFCPAMPRSA